MKPFKSHRGIAAPLPKSNINTDLIVPARYLTRARKEGFDDALFADLRSEADGTADPNFVLNQPPFDAATILVTGDNFGCGSSREHAVWSLADYGFRVVIAPSFADIFHGNSLQNGLLVIPTPQATVNELCTKMSETPGTEITVDLDSQTVVCGNLSYTFDIDPYRKECLLNGLSETADTLRRLTEIKTFEGRHGKSHPWLTAPN
ncbi:3-isopropylmalate dehydratase small subunit [Roseovarius aestuarii]|nr:3-isopropylmalate dehydratase small subunit [Roseovarius aestuarii]